MDFQGHCNDFRRYITSFVHFDFIQHKQGFNLAGCSATDSYTIVNASTRITYMKIYHLLSNDFISKWIPSFRELWPMFHRLLLLFERYSFLCHAFFLSLQRLFKLPVDHAGWHFFHFVRPFPNLLIFLQERLAFPSSWQFWNIFDDIDFRSPDFVYQSCSAYLEFPWIFHGCLCIYIYFRANSLGRLFSPIPIMLHNVSHCTYTCKQ